MCRYIFSVSWLQDIIGDIFVISLCFIPVIIDWKDWTRDKLEGPSWLWSYGSCNLYNQCLSPLMLWVRISIRARYTTLCDKACQISYTNKTRRRDITEILLNVEFGIWDCLWAYLVKVIVKCYKLDIYVFLYKKMIFYIKKPKQKNNFQKSTH